MDALIGLFRKLPGGDGMSDQALHISGAVTMAVIMFTVMALCAIVFTYMERKVSAYLQSRYGPMRTGGFHGWAQAVADMLKILGKEDIIPAEADKGLFITTGTFTRAAQAEATRDGAPPIDLIDGTQFVELLKDLQLGIHTEVVEVTKVDTAWFEAL